MEAVVKWFNNEKGYGFIEYNNNEHIFVHYTALKQNNIKSLSEGDIVEFNLLSTNNGYRATDVILKTTNNYINKDNLKENIEFIAAITTIIGFILNFFSIGSNLIKNEININCKNCKVEIIEKQEIENDLRIDID